MYKTIQIVTILGIFVFSSSPVYAYLDPGTGSMILQGLIASVALGLVTIKSWWYRLVGFFSKGQDSDRKDVSDDEI